MRIILTIDYSPWSSYTGGAQFATHNLATALVKRGHETTVIYSKPPWEKIKIPNDITYSISWATLPSTRSKRKTFLRPLSAISVNNILKKLIKKGTPTVVHSNGEEGGLIHLLRPEFQFGFISTPHHPHYPDIFFKYDKIPFIQNVYLALTNGKYLMQQSVARNADFCTPPSKWSADLVKRAFKIAEDRFYPIHNGVSDLFLKFHRNSDASDGPVVFFGRLTKTKGVDTLIKALGLLGDEAPKCLVIGRGDLHDWIKKEITRLNHEDKVSLIPWVSHEKLGQLLAGASLAVLPSREENFSLAVMEAMCVGVPTISTSVGGTPEIITHGQDGYLIEPDNPDQLKNAINYLRQNTAFAEYIGEKASMHIRNELTWAKAAERFEEIYRKSLHKNHII